jgi:hypothetical protein
MNDSVLLPVESHPSLFEKKPDWESEWQGMPEFVQEKQREYAKIIVRFRNQKDLDQFANLIGQKLNSKSQCTWYPELQQNRATTKKYVDNES